MKISDNGPNIFHESYIFSNLEPFTAISNYPSYDYVTSEATSDAVVSLALIFIFPSLIMILLPKN